MALSIVADAGHCRWGQDGDGWHLLAGDDLSVIAQRMPPGMAELRHRHARARQFFDVFAIEAALEMEGMTHRQIEGQSLHVPRGAAHQIRNDGDADVRFLVVSVPRTQGGRMRAPLEALR